jgi:hypothetical protein
VKPALVALIGLTFSTIANAQDFLQQWRDSATKAMNEFRTAHGPELQAAGWRFVTAITTPEGVPTADVFVQDVRARDESIRAASVLTVAYVPVPAFDLPEYQSSRALIWFDCRQGRYEERAIARYASVDGAGAPTSTNAEKPATVPPLMQPIEMGSAQSAILTAVCSAAL